MTQVRETQFLCPSCNARCTVQLLQSANVKLNPGLRDQVFNDTLNRTRCEQCGSEIFLPESVLYHDMAKRFLVWFQHHPGCQGSLTGTQVPYDDAVPEGPWDQEWIPVAFTWERFKTTIRYLEQGGEIPIPPGWQRRGEGNSPSGSPANQDPGRPGEIEGWRQQAELGDAQAQFEFAFVHYRGEKVVQDYPLARKWFTAAAEQGHVKAAFYLGAMLENGWGGELDLSGAASLYLKAANSNFMPAQHNLAMLLQNGQGVPKDLVEAHFWLSAAVRNNSEHSQKCVEELEGQMSSSEIELASQKLDEWWLKKETEALGPILLKAGRL